MGKLKNLHKIGGKGAKVYVCGGVGGGGSSKNKAIRTFLSFLFVSPMMKAQPCDESLPHFTEDAVWNHSPSLNYHVKACSRFN